MSVELRADKVMTPREILTWYLNMFTDRKIAGVIDLGHYKMIKEKKPDYVTNQNGQNITVDQLIEAQRETIVYARENCKRIEGLLKLEEEGKLEDSWSDEMVLSEVEQFEKAKDNGKVEAK